MPAMRFLERLVPEAMGAARLTLDWRVLAFATVIPLLRHWPSGLRLHGAGRASLRRKDCAMEAAVLPARAAIGSNIHSSWSRRRSPSRC